jgi:hypothetical protein
MGGRQMEAVTALLQQLLGTEKNPQAADGGSPLYWATSKGRWRRCCCMQSDASRSSRWQRWWRRLGSHSSRPERCRWGKRGPQQKRRRRLRRRRLTAGGGGRASREQGAYSHMGFAARQ